MSNVYEVTILDDNDYSVTTVTGSNYQVSPLNSNTYTVEGEFNVTSTASIVEVEDVYELTGNTTVFNLSNNPIPSTVNLFVNGLLQKKANFSLVGTVLTVTGFIPTNLDHILIKYLAS